MTSPDTQQALIDRLVADATPVRRLWPPAARLALWAALLAAMLIAIAVAAGWPFGAASRAPSLPWELVCAVAAALLWAALALRDAVPGRATPRGARLAVALLALAPLAFWLGDPSTQGELTLHAFIERGLPCTRLTIGLALLPCLTLLWAVHRGAPLSPRRAAAWSGGAGFLSGYLLTRIFCPMTDPAHLLIWHVLPVVGGIVVCTGLGSWWLARWRRRRPQLG
ncbi:MAG: NrsF family protein [bacterium]